MDGDETGRPGAAAECDLIPLVTTLRCLIYGSIGYGACDVREFKPGDELLFTDPDEATVWLLRGWAEEIHPAVLTMEAA